jgi:hypothetical protein
MDVLSEVLKAVKLGGALYYNAEFSAPWCFRSPGSRFLAPYLSADSRHLIIYHLLTEGRGYGQVEGEDRPIPLNAGDIVIIPHGDPHILGNVRPSRRWIMSKNWNECYLEASSFHAWVEAERSPDSSAAT